MTDNMDECGCEKGECCSPKQEKKQVIIDFLYLDLNVCRRCQGAENNLDKAISEVSYVLNSAGYEITVNKINITSRELAVKYEFVSSPTIKVNGRDIVLETHETLCEDCGAVCGADVDCRVWVDEGIEHTVPPKSMIVNAILKEVYGGNDDKKLTKTKYEIPQNLEVFFNAIAVKNNQNK